MKKMTEGRPVIRILAFALPMLVGNLFEQLYYVVDTMVVSRAIGVNALAAVGATSGVSYLIVGFSIGLASGMSIATAQRFGTGDMSKVRSSFFACMVLCISVSLLLTIVGLISVRPLLILLQTPPEIINESLRYISIIIAGIVASALSVMLGNILRALGNSVAPLLFLAIASATNICLDIVFIVGFGMGVDGAAYATIISQLISTVLSLIFISKKMPELRLTRHDMAALAQDCVVHIKLGFPVAFQGSIITIGNLVIQYTLNRLGPLAIAAFAATDKIAMITFITMNAIGMAMATYTAQNFGAGHFDRINRGVKGMIRVMLIFASVMGCVNIFVGQHIASTFIVDNAQAVNLIHQGLIVNSIGFPILPVLFISRNVLQGLGRTFILVVASMLELLMRILAALYFSVRLGYVGICMSNPLAWVGAGLPLVITMIFSLHKLAYKKKSYVIRS